MADINTAQINIMAKFLENLPDNGHGLNFYSFENSDKETIVSDMYPSLHDPQTVNFFFFVCLHQYGFWYSNEQGYMKPLFGLIDGKKIKGSDLLWRAAKKALDKNHLVFEPEQLASIDTKRLRYDIFIDDKGPIMFPDSEIRTNLTHSFGRWFVKNDIKPLDIIISANNAREPLGFFLKRTREIAGYDQDPLEKKNLLLAMTMANRPERFLMVKDLHNWSPITDYHLMRVALRLGLVDLNEAELESNKNRAWINTESEHEIRSVVHRAIQLLIQLSGRTISFIDEKMWSARHYCPEMSRPDCPECIFSGICEKKIELFQPIFRTTAY